MTRWRTALTAALLLATGTAWATEILVPADRVVVTQDALMILGTAPRGTVVPWSVESPQGAQTGEGKADWGDLFEVFVILDPGLNRVTVGGHQRQVFYAPGDEKPPAGFALQRVHAGDISRCDTCHQPLDFKLKDGGYAGACLTCHVVVAQNPAYTGDPRKDGHFRSVISTCKNCHEPHVGTNASLLKGTTTTLCGACHKAKAPQGARHAAEGCDGCHDPHFSGYPKILKGVVPEVCHGCHDEGKKVPADKAHPPPTGGNRRACQTCHEPHGAAEGLLVASSQDLCGACHAAALRGGHRQHLTRCSQCHDPHQARGNGLLKPKVSSTCQQCHAEVAKGKTVHAALEEGCNTCHNPHLQEDRARAQTTCGRCHEFAKDTELASLHGGLSIPAERCQVCHPPHASDQDKLLRGPLHAPLPQGKCSACHGGGAERSIAVAEPALRCRMCHPFETELKAKGGKLHDPVAEGECTTCHDPHLQRRANLLKAAEADLCRECHDVPAGKGGLVLHEAAETCSACHGAHGGTGKRFLSSQPPELCLACHDDPRQTGGTVHPALDEGCLACHDPHAGLQPGLLRGATVNTLCIECHEDTTAGKTVVHKAVERGCASCHAPHASPNPAFLLRPGNALCNSCHTLTRHHNLEAGPAVVAKYPGAEDFPLDGDQFACRGCHDPHGTEMKGLLPRPRAELCSSCHKQAP